MASNSVSFSRAIYSFIIARSVWNEDQRVTTKLDLRCGSGALCWWCGAVRPPHQPQSLFACSLDDGLSITGSDFVNGILMALCGTLLRIYWLLYVSITSQPAYPSRPMVMSHLVTPFLLGSSRVQKRWIRLRTGTSNSTSYLHLVTLSGKRDTCSPVTLKQCRQKTWTRTLRWITKTKNRWVSHGCLDVVG